MELLRHLNSIFPFRTHILIAVSGGLDSMVLIDILQHTKLYISVVHVNFQLRYSDSKEDESFLQDFCLNKKITFYKKKLNTKYFCLKNKSIQMIARNFRYSWFFRIIKDIDANYLVLGHHLDDSIETLFINLFRSSSLRGLVSITEIYNFLVRPLLPFTKTKILQYAKNNKIWWREDISNKDSKYLRNSIRNDIITHFYDRNSKTLFFLRNDNFIIQQSISKFFKNITINFVRKTFCWEINTRIFKKIKTLSVYLYKLFLPYGFCNLLDLESFLHYEYGGKQILSKKYKLQHNRNSLVITNKQKTHKIYALNFEVDDFMDHKALISIDFDRISWPISLTSCKKVNISFYEEERKKKIRKLLKEYKLSFFEKEEILLIINADNKIISIINIVYNLLFKITLKTNIILNIY